MSDDKKWAHEPVQQEEHLRKLIAAFKGSVLAAAWWEFKHGGLARSQRRASSQRRMI
jgi:hypothetical protein